MQAYVESGNIKTTTKFQENIWANWGYHCH